MIPPTEWISPCLKYALRINIESLRQIELECHRAGSVETGGILIGYYTGDELMAIVTEALPPPKDSIQCSRWFRRGVDGLRRILVNRWENEPRTYYIGEWHYHPASIVEPSGTDLTQMQNINTDPSYKCCEPIMLIAGYSHPRAKRPYRVFVFPQGRGHIEFDPKSETDIL